MGQTLTDLLSKGFYGVIDYFGLQYAFLVYLGLLLGIVFYAIYLYLGNFSFKYVCKLTAQSLIIVLPLAIPFYWFMMVTHYEDEYHLPINFLNGGNMERGWFVSVAVIGVIVFLGIVAIIKYIFYDRKKTCDEDFKKNIKL